MSCAAAGVQKRAQLGSAAAANADAVGALAAKMAAIGWAHAQQDSLVSTGAPRSTARAGGGGAAAAPAAAPAAAAGPAATAAAAAAAAPAAAAAGGEHKWHAAPPRAGCCVVARGAPWPCFPPPSPRAADLLAGVKAFMREHVMPAEAAVLRHE